MGETTDNGTPERQRKLDNFIDGVFQDPVVVELAAKLAAERAKSQSFFESLAASVLPGYVGDTHKTFVAQLLRQAETAGLYSPKGTP